MATGPYSYPQHRAFPGNRDGRAVKAVFLENVEDEIQAEQCAIRNARAIGIPLHLLEITLRTADLMETVFGKTNAAATPSSVHKGCRNRVSCSPFQSAAEPAHRSWHGTVELHRCLACQQIE